jgi:hypothetical protein
VIVDKSIDGIPLLKDYIWITQSGNTISSQTMLLKKQKHPKTRKL